MLVRKCKAKYGGQINIVQIGAFEFFLKVVLSELVLHLLHVNDMQFICCMSKDMSSICFQVYFGVGYCNLDQ
jgi:hypothetical protein